MPALPCSCPVLSVRSDLWTQLTSTHWWPHIPIWTLCVSLNRCVHSTTHWPSLLDDPQSRITQNVKVYSSTISFQFSLLSSLTEKKKWHHCYPNMWARYLKLYFFTFFIMFQVYKYEPRQCYSYLLLHSPGHALVQSWSILSQATAVESYMISPSPVFPNTHVILHTTARYLPTTGIFQLLPHSQK